MDCVYRLKVTLLRSLCTRLFDTTTNQQQQQLLLLLLLLLLIRCIVLKVEVYTKPLEITADAREICTGFNQSC